MASPTVIIVKMLSNVKNWFAYLAELPTVLPQSGLLPPLVASLLFAFLSIRVEDASILDFLRYAVNFLFLKQQYYEWGEAVE